MSTYQYLSERRQAETSKRTQTNADFGLKNNHTEKPKMSSLPISLPTQPRNSTNIRKLLPMKFPVGHSVSNTNTSNGSYCFDTRIGQISFTIRVSR